jgi:hypothetical protein
LLNGRSYFFLIFFLLSLGIRFFFCVGIHFDFVYYSLNDFRCLKEIKGRNEFFAALKINRAFSQLKL